LTWQKDAIGYVLLRAGIDYRPIMRDAIARACQTTNVEIIWASTREVFNVIEADEMLATSSPRRQPCKRSCRRLEQKRQPISRSMLSRRSGTTRYRSD